MDKKIKKNLILGMIDVVIIMAMIIGIRIMLPENQHFFKWRQIIWLGIVLAILTPSITIGFGMLYKDKRTKWIADFVLALLCIGAFVYFLGGAIFGWIK